MILEDMISYENGVLILKTDLPFKADMLKKREVKAIEEYIECTCGTEMLYVGMVQIAGIWECPICKKKTSTYNNILAPLKKVT